MIIKFKKVKGNGEFNVKAKIQTQLIHPLKQKAQDSGLSAHRIG